MCRYRLMGAGKRLQLKDLNERLDLYRASPLSLDAKGKEEEIGWVMPHGIEAFDLAPDAPWDMSHAQVDQGFMLRMRIEKRLVPAQLLQLIYRERFYNVEKRTGKTPGPKERRDLKEEVRVELMARALPAISFVDAFWRDREGELHVFSTGKRARQLFETLFTKTFADYFQQTLVRVVPPLLGLPADEWQQSSTEGLRALENIALTAPMAFAETRES